MIDLSKVEPGQTVITRDGHKKVVESIRFDENPKVDYPWKVGYEGGRVDYFLEDGSWRDDGEKYDFDIVGIVEPSTEVVERVVDVDQHVGEVLKNCIWSEIFEEEVAPMESDFGTTSIAGELLIRYGQKDANSKELTALAVRKAARQRHTDHIRGISTWTFRDGSSLIETNNFFEKAKLS